jgi:hypothetical protein
MRYIGPYDPAALPSFADLATASTVDRRVALTALVPTVTAAAAAHTAAYPNVHALAHPVLTDDEKKALIDGYDGRSAAIKRLLEDMRVSLDPRHLDLCPFCNLDSRAELDHFLPKTKHHEFALYGPNLIPICPICNKAKGTVIANKGGDRVMLMPTADIAAENRVLIAHVKVQPPVPRVTYSIDPHAPISAAELNLVRRHFDRLGLARRYRGRATSLLPVLRQSTAKRGGSLADAHDVIARGHQTALDEEPVNSWKTALYEAIIAQGATFENWLIS